MENSALKHLEIDETSKLTNAGPSSEAKIHLAHHLVVQLIEQFTVGWKVRGLIPRSAKKKFI